MIQYPMFPDTEIKVVEPKVTFRQQSRGTRLQKVFDTAAKITNIGQTAIDDAAVLALQGAISEMTSACQEAVRR